MDSGYQLSYYLEVLSCCCHVDRNQWVFSDDKQFFAALLVDTKVFKRLWIETRTKLKGKLHNQIFSASGSTSSHSLPLAIHSCPWNGPLGWLGRNACISSYAVGWREGGRWQRAKKKNGWEAGGISYPRLFKRFHCWSFSHSLRVQSSDFWQITFQVFIQGTIRYIWVRAWKQSLSGFGLTWL